MKGIILAGGSGTRLNPLTTVTSKQLLPIYDKPMIYYPMAVLMEAGIREILIISTPEDTPKFMKLFGDGSHIGLSLDYKIQPKPEGLAQAFIIGENFIGNDNICMILGDNIFYDPNMKEKLIRATNLIMGATLFAYKVDDPRRFGVIEFDKNNHALSIEEKPLHPKSNYCVTGLYFYDNNVVKYAKELKPSKRNELEITDLNNIYLNNNTLQVEVLTEEAKWLDAGTVDSLLETALFIRDKELAIHKKIGCLEEIAYRNGWIDSCKLEESIHSMGNNNYKQYVKKLLK